MILLAPIAFLLGLMVGSFLNVLITRLPRGEDVVWKRSHCRSCNKKIGFYDNIPVVSWLLLKGRCRHCKSKISIQYPIVELMTAIIFVILLPNEATPHAIFKYGFDIILTSCFLVHFIIDFKHHLLPNFINITLAIIFSIYQFFWGDLLSGLLGATLGFIFPFSVTYLFFKARGVVGLGGGDIKLYSALGLMLGVKGIFINIFLSCFLGAIIGGVFLMIKRSDRYTRIPFGPYIIIVGTIQIYFPNLIKGISSFLF